MLDDWTPRKSQEPILMRGPFRLSREERDHIAGHALDSMKALALKLSQMDCEAPGWKGVGSSDRARKIAALSNLLGDIGWERSEARPLGEGYLPGELFPVAQLRPWLEEWQRQDNEALVELKAAINAPSQRGAQAIADAQTKLGTGAILLARIELARIEKWMASHGN